MVTLFDNDITRPTEHRYTLTELVKGFGIDIWDRERPYPIFDESYRETLNSRIYDHFAYRRIAASTPQQFVFLLNRRMRENMPAYNEVYKLVAREDLNPFNTTEGVDSTSQNVKQSGTNDSTSHSVSTSDGTTINSNTPASFLDNAKDPKYMSTLVQTNSTGENDTEGHTEAGSTSDTTGDHNYAGRSGYLGDSVLNALTSGFLATDLMVCDMLEPLFMQIWNDQPL